MESGCIVLSAALIAESADMDIESELGGVTIVVESVDSVDSAFSLQAAIMPAIARKANNFFIFFIVFGLSPRSIGVAQR